MFLLADMKMNYWVTRHYAWHIQAIVASNLISGYVILISTRHSNNNNNNNNFISFIYVLTYSSKWHLQTKQTWSTFIYDRIKFKCRIHIYPKSYFIYAVYHTCFDRVDKQKLIIIVHLMPGEIYTTTNHFKAVENSLTEGNYVVLWLLCNSQWRPQSGDWNDAFKSDSSMFT